MFAETCTETIFFFPVNDAMMNVKFLYLILMLFFSISDLNLDTTVRYLIKQKNLKIYYLKKTFLLASEPLAYNT